MCLLLPDSHYLEHSRGNGGPREDEGVCECVNPSPSLPTLPGRGCTPAMRAAMAARPIGARCCRRARSSVLEPRPLPVPLPACPRAPLALSSPRGGSASSQPPPPLPPPPPPMSAEAAGASTPAKGLPKTLLAAEASSVGLSEPPCPSAQPTPQQVKSPGTRICTQPSGTSKLGQ